MEEGFGGWMCGERSIFQRVLRAEEESGHKKNMSEKQVRVGENGG